MRWHYSILSFFNWSQISSRHTGFFSFLADVQISLFRTVRSNIFFCIRFIFFLRSILYVHSCLMVWGASARPFTLSRSAVLRNAGNWSWATLTSPAYINSKMAVRCWNGTSFRMMIGCLAGFSSKRACKKWINFVSMGFLTLWKLAAFRPFGPQVLASGTWSEVDKFHAKG